MYSPSETENDDDDDDDDDDVQGQKGSLVSPSAHPVSSFWRPNLRFVCTTGPHHVSSLEKFPVCAHLGWVSYK
jgi:hypothetical protein